MIDPSDQLMKFFKLNNIFSPAINQIPAQQPMGNEPDLMSSIQALLSPRDEQFQNYGNLIGRMPQRADFPEPGIWTKIRAHIAGMGANNSEQAGQVREGIENAKYYKALGDWKNQLDPTKDIAQMEQTRNVGNRATGLGVLQRKQADDKLAHQVEVDADKSRQADEKLAITKARADAYIKAKEFAMSNPDYKGYIDKTGMLVYVNEKNPAEAPIKTDIDTGKLGDIEKNELKIKGDISLVEKRGAESRKTEENRQSNRLETEGVRQRNRVDLKTTPSGNSLATKNLTPSAMSTARINKAIDIISEHPELKVYFVYGGNKKPTGELIAPENPDDAGFAIAQRLMSSNQGDVKLPSSDVKQETFQLPTNRELTRPVQMPQFDRATIEAKKKKVGEGRVLVWSKEMGFGSIPLDQVKDLKPGTVVVK